MATETLDFN